MAIANRTNSVITATITQASLATGIKAAMAAAGFTEIKDYTATNRNLVYEVVTDALNTFGKTYLFVSITSALVVSTQLLATFNTSTNASTGGSTTTINTAFTSGTNITVTAFNLGNEFRMVQLVQGSVVVPIGVLVPEQKPTWWDLNTFPFAFVLTGSSFGTLRSSSINPYSNDSYLTSTGTTSLSGVNPITSRRDIVAGVLLYSGSNNGVAAKTSDDLASVAATGTSRYDLVQPQGTTTQYAILNPAAGGLAVRMQ